ncbi:MAG: hypothetical protein ABSA31_02280 [Acidimicrobiales bacterium]
MTGLAGLVPLAEMLAALAGSREGATKLAVEVLERGDAVLPRSFDDLQVTARIELVSSGVVNPAGAVNPGRAAELVTVCQVLAAMTQAAAVSVPEPRLVLSAPPGTVPIADLERLDTFVLDIIRQSTTTLDIGGVFWNADGFAMLAEVLLPAIRSRHVCTTVYMNADPQHDESLKHRMGGFARSGAVRIRWFSGPRPPCCMPNLSSAIGHTVTSGRRISPHGGCMDTLKLVLS